MKPLKDHKKTCWGSLPQAPCEYCSFMKSSTPFLLLKLVSCCCVLMVLQDAFPQVPESAFDRDPWPASEEGPVKVFLLAGQSNMQGHASLRTLEYLIYNEETAEQFQQWKTMEGKWAERSDVWVWTTDGERGGKLRPGYGANEWKLGPELGIGWVLGEHFDHQVALIKTCWGGRSVRRDFLPPNADQPTEEELEMELERLRSRNPDATLDDVREPYGRAYRDMIAHTRAALENPGEYFPQYDPDSGRKLELAGMVWFQGWNDMVDGSQREKGYADYTTRLTRMIESVRSDLGVPDLPVVIGQLGASDNAEFHRAQEAVASEPSMAGSVEYVPTRQFMDPELEKMVRENVWQSPDWVRFYNHGSDRGYHYLGSAKIMVAMGEAFGRSMIRLVSQ